MESADLDSDISKEKRDIALKSFLLQVQAKRKLDQAGRNINHKTQQPTRSADGNTEKDNPACGDGSATDYFSHDRHLLSKHLQQYKDIMKVQPRRHTEAQIQQERLRQKWAQDLAYQQQLDQLRLSRLTENVTVQQEYCEEQMVQHESKKTEMIGDNLCRVRLDKDDDLSDISMKYHSPLHKIRSCDKQSIRAELNPDPLYIVSSEKATEVHEQGVSSGLDVQPDISPVLPCRSGSSGHIDLLAMETVEENPITGHQDIHVPERDPQHQFIPLVSGKNKTTDPKLTVKRVVQHPRVSREHCIDDPLHMSTLNCHQSTSDGRKHVISTCPSVSGYEDTISTVHMKMSLLKAQLEGKFSEITNTKDENIITEKSQICEPSKVEAKNLKDICELEKGYGGVKTKKRQDSGDTSNCKGNLQSEAEKDTEPSKNGTSRIKQKEKGKAGKKYKKKGRKVKGKENEERIAGKDNRKRKDTSSSSLMEKYVEPEHQNEEFVASVSRVKEFQASSEVELYEDPLVDGGDSRLVDKDETCIVVSEDCRVPWQEDILCGKPVDESFVKNVSVHVDTRNGTDDRPEMWADEFQHGENRRKTLKFIYQPCISQGNDRRSVVTASSPTQITNTVTVARSKSGRSGDSRTWYAGSMESLSWKASESSSFGPGSGQFQQQAAGNPYHQPCLPQEQLQANFYKEIAGTSPALWMNRDSLGASSVNQSFNPRGPEASMDNTCDKISEMPQPPGHPWWLYHAPFGVPCIPMMQMYPAYYNMCGFPSVFVYSQQQRQQEDQAVLQKNQVEYHQDQNREIVRNSEENHMLTGCSYSWNDCRTKDGYQVESNISSEFIVRHEQSPLSQEHKIPDGKQEHRPLQEDHLCKVVCSLAFDSKVIDKQHTVPIEYMYCANNISHEIPENKIKIPHAKGSEENNTDQQNQHSVSVNVDTTQKTTNQSPIENAGQALLESWCCVLEANSKTNQHDSSNEHTACPCSDVEKEELSGDISSVDLLESSHMSSKESDESLQQRKKKEFLDSWCPGITESKWVPKRQGKKYKPVGDLEENAVPANKEKGSRKIAEGSESTGNKNGTKKQENEESMCHIERNRNTVEFEKGRKRNKQTHLSRSQCPTVKHDSAEGENTSISEDKFGKDRNDAETRCRSHGKKLKTKRQKFKSIDGHGVGETKGHDDSFQEKNMTQNVAKSETNTQCIDPESVKKTAEVIVKNLDLKKGVDPGDSGNGNERMCTITNVSDHTNSAGSAVTLHTVGVAKNDTNQTDSQKSVSAFKLPSSEGWNDDEVQSRYCSDIEPKHVSDMIEEEKGSQVIENEQTSASLKQNYAHNYHLLSVNGWSYASDLWSTDQLEGDLGKNGDCGKKEQKAKSVSLSSKDNVAVNPVLTVKECESLKRKKVAWADRIEVWKSPDSQQGEKDEQSSQYRCSSTASGTSGIHDGEKSALSCQNEQTECNPSEVPGMSKSKTGNGTAQKKGETIEDEPSTTCAERHASCRSAQDRIKTLSHRSRDHSAEETCQEERKPSCRFFMERSLHGRSGGTKRDTPARFYDARERHENPRTSGRRYEEDLGQKRAKPSRQRTSFWAPRFDKKREEQRAAKEESQRRQVTARNDKTTTESGSSRL